MEATDRGELLRWKYRRGRQIREASQMVMTLFPTAPNRTPRRTRQSSRAHTRNGICKAAVRALTGGELYLQGNMTLEQVVITLGSNAHYVSAAVLLIKPTDTTLINEVVHGNISILAAAKLVEPQVRAFEAFEAACPTDKATILGNLLANSTAATRLAAAAEL